MSALTIVSGTLPLEALAAKINHSHRQCQEAFKASLLHARETGELLLQAKQQVQHGQWLPWLQTHCEVSERTAQSYMKVAREWNAIEAKSATVADLGLKEALLLLSPGKPAEEAATESVPTKEDLKHAAYVSANWSNDLLGWIFCLRAMGWTPPQIAEGLQQPQDTVDRVLEPRPCLFRATSRKGERESYLFFDKVRREQIAWYRLGGIIQAIAIARRLGCAESVFNRLTMHREDALYALRDVPDFPHPPFIKECPTLSFMKGGWERWHKQRQDGVLFLGLLLLADSDARNALGIQEAEHKDGNDFLCSVLRWGGDAENCALDRPLRGSGEATL